MDKVIDDDAIETPVVPPGQGKDANKGETVTLSKAEVESLRRERDEARESERYWAGVARSGGKTPDAAEEPEDGPDASEFIEEEEANPALAGDTPEKLVDELAAQGVAAISKRGFITASDARKLAAEVALKVSRDLIGRERQKISTDAQLMTEFPELRDQNSELFKETAKLYQRAVGMDPNAKKTPAALYLAAKAAKAGLKPPPKPVRNDDDEDETDRRRRSDSQDGRPRTRTAEADDYDDMLGDEARSVIKQMGISEEEFKASQKQTAARTRSRR